MPESAHCRSSTITTLGAPRDRAWMNARIASNSLDWPCTSGSTSGAASAEPGGPASSSGSRRPSSRLPGPSSAGSRPGSTARMHPRSASTNGAYGVARPPVGRHEPLSRVPSRAATRDANSSTRRVLPMPASPPMTTVAALPGDDLLERRFEARQLAAPSDEPPRIDASVARPRRMIRTPGRRSRHATSHSKLVAVPWSHLTRGGPRAPLRGGAPAPGTGGSVSRSGAPDLPGDLRAAQALRRHRHRGPSRAVQDGQRREDLGLGFLCDRDGLRRRELDVVDKLASVPIGHRDPPPAACREVVADAPQPAAHVLGDPIRAHLGKEPDERLLRQILGRGLVPDERRESVAAATVRYSAYAASMIRVMSASSMGAVLLVRRQRAGRGRRSD